jgi:hypothetical protein
MLQLCARLYSNVSYVGSHDSYAIGVDNRESLGKHRPCAFDHATFSVNQSGSIQFVFFSPRRDLADLCQKRSRELKIVTQQLDDGIRMLQVQVHNQTGVLQLCHTSCVSQANS